VRPCLLKKKKVKPYSGLEVDTMKLWAQIVIEAMKIPCNLSILKSDNWYFQMSNIPSDLVNCKMLLGRVEYVQVHTRYKQTDSSIFPFSTRKAKSTTWWWINSKYELRAVGRQVTGRSPCFSAEESVYQDC
jgi:hypothetical protein